MQKKKEILRVENLKVCFNTPLGKVRVLDDLSFSVDAGTILGVVGESGSGKTTLALSLFRLLPENAEIEGGKIILDDRDLLSLEEKEVRKLRGRKIAMIFQDPVSALNPVLSVGSQVMEQILIHQEVPLRFAYKRAQEALKRTVELFRLVEIPDAEKRVLDFPHEFSGGMCQRIMIAQALATNPPLLVADEPTSFLDATIQAQIFEILLKAKEKFDTSILLITHDLKIAANFTDKILVIYAGRPVEYADSETLFARPSHPYTQGLLRAVCDLEKKGYLYTISGEPPDLLNLPEGCCFYPRCDFAEDICKNKKPIFIEVEKGHFVACHFAEKKEDLKEVG